MEGESKVDFFLGLIVGAFITLGCMLLANDHNRALVVQKYKSGEIVCAEIGKELICRSAE